MEELKTLRLKLGFKYCTKSDTIIDHTIIQFTKLVAEYKKKLAKQEECLP
jgi:hypothetical protein